MLIPISNFNFYLKLCCLPGLGWVWVECSQPYGQMPSAPHQNPSEQNWNTVWEALCQTPARKEMSDWLVILLECVCFGQQFMEPDRVH